MASNPYDPRPSTNDPREIRGAGFGGGQTAARPALHWQEPVVPLMQQVFEGQSPPDPGSPRLRRVFWVIAAVLIAAVTGMQQFKVLAEGLSKSAPTVAPVDPDAAKKPVKATPLGDDLDAPDLAGRIAVKLSQAMGAGNEMNKGQFAQLVDPAQQPQVDHAVRVIPAYTELSGKENGLAAIERMRARLDDDEELDDAKHAELTKDLNDLSALYTDGSAALTSDQRKRIEERFGWQGRLALTFDQPDAPERAALLANGGVLLAFLVLVGLGLVCVVFAGLGMFIWAVVLLATGKLKRRLDKPALGGSIGVEVLVVFLAGFLGLQLVLSAVAVAAAGGVLGETLKNDGEGPLTVVSLLAQWVILPMVVFYPRLRGYSAERTRRAIGWHRGEGFGREIMAGVAGYLACIPLYLGAVVIALVLSLIEQAIKRAITGHEPTGPVNPIGAMLSQSWWVALLVIVLATVWAPIVEETVFRGGLFRQLSARMGIVWSALLSGTVFAMMHGYSPSLFPPLIALGFGFAVMRAWRGSLVSCVTAHALHNGTLTVVMLVMFSLLK